jgi:hypothetical protein
MVTWHNNVTIASQIDIQMSSWMTKWPNLLVKRVNGLSNDTSSQNQLWYNEMTLILSQDIALYTLEAEQL